MYCHRAGAMLALDGAMVATAARATIDALYAVSGKAELVDGRIVEMPPEGPNGIGWPVQATCMTDLHRCRVCGLWHDPPSWGEDGQSPDYTFCACCGVEAGYQDCTPDAARAFREKWLAREAPWDEPRARRVDWDLNEQLRHIPPGFL